MAHQTDLIPFRLANGTPGAARILIADLPDGRTLVTCMDNDQEDDAAVNMMVEELFAIVCKKYRLKPASVVWLEYNPDILKMAGGNVGGWELVSWKNRPGVSPSWRQMTPDDWASLGTEPPPGPDDLPPSGRRRGLTP